MNSNDEIFDKLRKYRLGRDTIPGTFTFSHSDLSCSCDLFYEVVFDAIQYLCLHARQGRMSGKTPSEIMLFRYTEPAEPQWSWMVAHHVRSILARYKEYIEKRSDPDLRRQTEFLNEFLDVLAEPIAKKEMFTFKKQ